MGNNGVDDPGGVGAQIDAQASCGSRQVIDQLGNLVHVAGLVLGAQTTGDQVLMIGRHQ